MFAQLILPLRDRRFLRIVADFAEETATQYRQHVYEFRDVDVIALEGIYLLKRAFQAHYDLSVWIDCSFDTALERSITRAQEGLTLRRKPFIFTGQYSFPPKRFTSSETTPGV